MAPGTRRPVAGGGVPVSGHDTPCRTERGVVRQRGAGTRGRAGVCVGVRALRWCCQGRLPSRLGNGRLPGGGRTDSLFTTPHPASTVCELVCPTGTADVLALVPSAGRPTPCPTPAHARLAVCHAVVDAPTAGWWCGPPRHMTPPTLSSRAPWHVCIRGAAVRNVRDRPARLGRGGTLVGRLSRRACVAGADASVCAATARPRALTDRRGPPHPPAPCRGLRPGTGAATTRPH